MIDFSEVIDVLKVAAWAIGVTVVGYFVAALLMRFVLLPMVGWVFGVA